MIRIGSIVRKAVGALDPVTVPIGNRRLARAAAAGAAALPARIESALARAIAWFAKEGEIEMSALYTLVGLHRAGLEPRLAFMEARVAAAIAAVNNPHWRYFDHAYDPWSPAALAKPQHIPSHPIEVLMLKCLYADRLGLGDPFLWELAATDDRGSYGTTHIVAGGVLLRDFSRIPAARIEAMIQATVPSLVAAQRRARAGDIFAERIMILQWLGRHDLVEPAWLERLLRAQNADGGWSGRFALRRAISNQHTTCIAIAALAQHRSGGSLVAPRPARASAG